MKRNRYNPSLPPPPPPPPYQSTLFHFLKTWLHCLPRINSMCRGDGVGSLFWWLPSLWPQKKGLKKQMGFHCRICIDWDWALSLLDMHHDPCIMYCLTCLRHQGSPPPSLSVYGFFYFLFFLFLAMGLYFGAVFIEFLLALSCIIVWDGGDPWTMLTGPWCVLLVGRPPLWTAQISSLEAK
jgi:hypothetical protein